LHTGADDQDCLLGKHAITIYGKTSYSQLIMQIINMDVVNAGTYG